MKKLRDLLSAVAESALLAALFPAVMAFAWLACRDERRDERAKARDAGVSAGEYARERAERDLEWSRGVRAVRGRP